MKPAPLQLADYFLTALLIEANPDFDHAASVPFDFDSLSVLPEVRLEEDRIEEGTRWFVSLHITQNLVKGKNIPYKYDLQIQGIVLASPYLTGATLHRAVCANGPTMLFGAAREIIRAATGRGPWPAVIIPSTNFLDGLPPADSAPPALPDPVAKVPKKKAPTKKNS